MPVNCTHLCSWKHRIPINPPFHDENGRFGKRTDSKETKKNKKTLPAQCRKKLSVHIHLQDEKWARYWERSTFRKKVNHLTWFKTLGGRTNTNPWRHEHPKDSGRKPKYRKTFRYWSTQNLTTQYLCNRNAKRQQEKTIENKVLQAHVWCGEGTPNPLRRSSLYLPVIWQIDRTETLPIQALCARGHTTRTPFKQRKRSARPYAHCDHPRPLHRKDRTGLL